MVAAFAANYQLDVERIHCLIPSIDKKDNVERMLSSLADLMQVDWAICNYNVKGLIMSQLKLCF
jgi:hypothetical protein